MVVIRVLLLQPPSAVTHDLNFRAMEAEVWVETYGAQLWELFFSNCSPPLRQSSIVRGSPRRLGWPTWSPGSHLSVPSQPRNYKCAHLAFKNKYNIFLQNQGAGDGTQAFLTTWQLLSYQPTAALSAAFCLPAWDPVLCSCEHVSFYRQSYGFLQGKVL